jgi:hypothetical protein
MNWQMKALVVLVESRSSNRGTSVEPVLKAIRSIGEPSAEGVVSPNRDAGKVSVESGV